MKVTYIKIPNNTEASRSTMANMRVEKTTQELIFELGNDTRSLTLHKYLGLNINSVQFRLVEEKFNRFKTKALILGVSLPDLTEDTSIDKFLTDVTTEVYHYIRESKTVAMSQLFATGKAVEEIIFFNNYAIHGHF